MSSQRCSPAVGRTIRRTGRCAACEREHDRRTREINAEWDEARTRLLDFLEAAEEKGLRTDGIIWQLRRVDWERAEKLRVLREELGV